MNCAFVFGLLPQLDQREPVMRSELLLTIRTLSILLHELNYLGDLDPHSFVDFSVEHNFDLHTLGVGFCPNKGCWLHVHFVQSFDFFQEYCEHFLAFPLTVDPWWPLESLAVSTVVDVLSFKEFLLLEWLNGAGRADGAHSWRELDAA